MKKFLFLYAIAPLVILLDSCAQQKHLVPSQTLAQVCADSFPCRDSLIFIEVEVEVPKDSIIYVDSTDCPPSDTASVVKKTGKVYFPQKKIPVKIQVMAPGVIDSALRVAYKDLQVQYAKSIQALKECQAKAKEKAKPRADWKVWLMALGLLVVVVVQLFNRKG